MGGDHILIQFLTLKTSNFTMTQNLLNRLHYISANQQEPHEPGESTQNRATHTLRNGEVPNRPHTCRSEYYHW